MTRQLRWILSIWLLIVCAAAIPCTPSVEEWPTQSTAVFRRHSDDFDPCPVDEAGYNRVVAGWLRERPPAAPPLTGLSLGRAVYFPWISTYLAERALDHPAWDSRQGTVRHGTLNGLAAAILSEEMLLSRVAVPFCASPHVPVGVSVEKVLVGAAPENVASKPARGRKLVPYDAQLWLRLERRPDRPRALPGECE